MHTHNQKSVSEIQEPLHVNNRVADVAQLAALDM